jgi:hypothetical protein
MMSLLQHQRGWVKWCLPEEFLERFGWLETLPCEEIPSLIDFDVKLPFDRDLRRQIQQKGLLKLLPL